VSVVMTNTSPEQLGAELIEVVTDRWSYREVFRHSSAVLCQELKSNINLRKYIASQKDIVQRLVTPLTDNLYDTLILCNILQAVKYLLEDKVSVYDNFGYDLKKLQQTWAEGAHHQTIKMRFGKSQQVVKICNECLKLLELNA